MSDEMGTMTTVPTESESRLAGTEQVKHTPGPWTVVLRGERGTFHIPEAQKHEAANTEDGVDGYTVSSANARLIAAAPDMLAALANVRKLISEAALTGFNCKDGDWAERLFASQQVTSSAIAKAEGRTP